MIIVPSVRAQLARLAKTLVGENVWKAYDFFDEEQDWNVVVSAQQCGTEENFENLDLRSWVEVEETDRMVFHYLAVYVLMSSEKDENAIWECKETRRHIVVKNPTSKPRAELGSGSVHC